MAAERSAAARSPGWRDRPGDDRAQVPRQKQGGLHAAAKVSKSPGQSALAGTGNARQPVTSGNNPAQSAIGSWNLVIGFGFIIAGVALATKWR